MTFPLLDWRSARWVPKREENQYRKWKCSSGWEWELQWGFADPKRPPPVSTFWNSHCSETLDLACFCRWGNTKLSTGRGNVGIRERTTDIIAMKSPCKKSQPRDKGPGWNTDLFILIFLLGFFFFLFQINYSLGFFFVVVFCLVPYSWKEERSHHGYWLYFPTRSFSSFIICL